MEKLVSYHGYFSISFEKNTFYTETRKVELRVFFTRFTHEKKPQNNFSYQNFRVENNYFHVQFGGLVQNTPNYCAISVKF